MKRVVKILTFTLVLALAATEVFAGRTVTDQLGRRVTLPDNPRRVVALAPSITEIMFTLGQESRLVGVTRFSDYPPETAALPKVGSYVNLDLEKIVALSPDLCIAVKDGNPIAIIRRLEAFGIPVYAVDPRNLDAVMDTILEIGRLLNAETSAEAQVREMRHRIDAVQSRVADVAERPKVFIQIGISPIVGVGTDTFFNELILLAGGRNLTQGSTPYPRYSREQVMSLAPEVFIITSMARGEVFERVKSEWSRWPDMPAVKNDRIYLVDSNIFDRSTPRLIDALELLARLIHPQIFGEGS